MKVECLYEFIGRYPATFDYYPDQSEIMRLPKQWIANVAYAILGDTFSAWVKAKIEENHEKKAEKGNLMIDMDPEVHAAFQGSTHVSRKYQPIIRFSDL